MKKILLLIIALLPFLGIGQSQLVRWNGSNGTSYSNAPSLLVSNVNASNATGTNTFTNVQNYFRGVNYTTTNAPNNAQYMEFAISANTGYDIALSNFSFTHNRSTNGARTFIVRYSTNGTTWANIGSAVTVNTTGTAASIDLSGLSVLSGTTFYVRVHPYNAAQASGNNDYFYIRHGANSATDNLDTVGPRFSGTVNCNQGDPSVYGANTWIGYVYDWVSGPETIENPIPNNYLGFVTEAQTFDRDNGTGALSGVTSSFCGTAPTGSFFVRYKMNVNIVGKYAVTVGGDDGYRFSIDGGATWEINNWGQHSYETTTKEVCLNGNTNLVLEYFEGPVDSRVSFSYVDVTPVAPTSITGTNTICSGTSTTITANGTSVDGVNTFYQWGTGTVGTNIIAGATSSTYTTPNLTSNTTYWVRVTSPGTCVFNTAAQTRTVTVTTPSAPTGISGTLSICSGSGTTLTATGGTGTTFQWGTGAVVGDNIIAGQTTASLPTGNLTSNTTFWVRRISGLCFSNAQTVTVTVSQAATAPTAISGESFCPGSTITLTASGGTGSTYQWGTGATVGSNIIAGATTASISVSPNATTTYWVRRVNTAPCGTTTTSGITKSVTVAVPGDPAVFGDNEWNVYGYNSGGNSAPTNYRGYYVQNLGSNVGMDTKLKWAALASPSSASDWQGCPITAGSNYTFVHKRMGFPCGNYLLTYTYYDDETTIIIKDANGVTSTINSTSYYNGGAGLSQAVNGTTTYALDANSTIEIRTTNSGGNEAKLGIIFTPNAYTPPVAPTSITGVNSICLGTSTTLTANGTSGTYEWGTGTTVGLNPIAGTTNTITVSPTSTTTYWVRVKGTFPCPDSAGITRTVTVTAPPVAPTTITGTNSICSGTTTTLTATAGLGTYEWGTGATVGSNIIAGATTNTYTTPNLASTTTYWVRVKATSPCTTDSAGITRTVTVTLAPVAPTTITGTNSICSGTTTTLTATAGLGTYEWGTGATVGSNIIAGATSNTYTTPNLNSTTTYWVRVKGTSPCGDSAGISTTVTVNPSATAPTAITGIETSYCAGDAITLTASGGIGTTYQWGTGATIGNNIISGATAASISVSPSSTTTYWVRRQNTSPCSGVTSGVTKTITVLPTPGDPAVFGTNEWNVYGYNSGGNSNPSDYRGYYVQNLGSNAGIDTKVKWSASTSPSAATDWQGCPVNNDGFTMVHKRKGFPCGRYNIAFTYYDEDTVVIITDATGTTTTLNFAGSYNGGVGLSQPINGSTTYALDANSTIEIRTTDITPSSEAKLGMTITGASTSIYNGTWNQEASYTDIEIQSDYNLPADITVCTCTVVDGKTFTVPANKTLTVIGNTTAVGTGKFIIENNGGFVQVNDNSTYTGVPTSFTSKRQTQSVYRYDITYWSSPVENFVLKNVSPLTLFDKFFSWNSNTQAWTPHKTNVAANLLEIMGTGKGYSIRAPQSFNIEGTAGALPQTHMAQFIGIPHNGVKQITVSNGAENRWNMIGNPYPSALNIAEFLEVNKDVVDGTLYFWTHKTPVILNSPNPDFALYSATDYVAVNLSGNISNGNDAGVVASAPSGNSLGVNTGDDFLNVASGQAFFIKGKETGAISNQVTFNNKMRVRTGGENAQFFKPGVTTPVNNWQNTGKHRIWLNATTSQNDFNQTLVGYIQNATNGLDWGYDGQSLSSGAISIYSILNDQKLSIQARSLPFITQDEVPLGYSTTRTGTARITLDKVDGLFQGQDIYLEDNLLNVVHNLKNASYTFDIVPGTFNDRFVLRYLPSENLGTDLPTLDVNALVIYNLNNQISVKAKDLTIESVIIYDMQGRVLFTKNQVNAQEFTTQSLALYKQVVLVKVITENKAEVVKKVILN